MIKILIKRGTATQWSASTTPLASGELGLDTTNNILKAGNGTDLWATLNQISLTSSQVDELARDAIGSALVGGSGISVNVNDAADSITVSIDNTIATKSYTDTAISNLINSAPATLDTLNELATALGNDANFATTVTNSLAGKVSKSGGDIITPSTASTIGLIIKGAASQTANLQEWQLNNGFQALRVLSNGSILLGNTNVDSNNYLSFIKAGGSVGGNAGIRFGNDADGSNQQTLTVNTGNANLILEHKNTTGAFIIKGATSQTANLLEWQNSASTVLGSITANGYFYGKALELENYGTLSTINLVANEVPVYVVGAASQTADLQQWMDSGLNTIAKIDANGNFKGGLTYEINIQTGTSYTFALSDSKSVVLLNNENNITAYIPTNSIAFPIGSSITVVQSGLGQVTIQALTPATTSILSNAVTLAAPRLRGYGSSVTLIKVTAEQWFAVGDIY